MRDPVPASQAVRVSVLSIHFVDQFRKRLGEEPNLELVNQILAGSKRIRKQLTLYRKVRGDFRPYELLGEFWHHEMGIILLVNERACKAVTVFTYMDKYPEHPKPPFGSR